MHVSWTFTGDGLLAFAGGALALIGVWWSNHQSVKNLQKQLDAEKKVREDGRKCEAQSLAIVAAFEMDFVYRFYVQGTERGLQAAGKGPISADAFLVKRVENRPFPIYQGIADRLGVLDTPLVAAIVRFYTDMAAFLMILEKMSSVAEQGLRPDQKDKSKQEWDLLIEQCRVAIQHLKRCSHQAFQRLQDFTGIPSEQLTALNAAMEPDAQTN